MSTTTKDPMDRLVFVAAKIATRGAQEWARQQGRTLDPDEFACMLEIHMKMRLAQQLEDAREAMRAGMEDAAEQTFRAGCILIGIAAAKACHKGFMAA